MYKFALHRFVYIRFCVLLTLAENVSNHAFKGLYRLVLLLSWILVSDSGHEAETCIASGVVCSFSAGRSSAYSRLQRVGHQ